APGRLCERSDLIVSRGITTGWLCRGGGAVTGVLIKATGRRRKADGPSSPRPRRSPKRRRPPGPRRSWPAHCRAGQRHVCGNLRLLGLPEDLGNLVDLLQQLVRLGRVGRRLGPGSAGQLGGLVEELVELRVLLEVVRLEVVRPQHP